MGRTFGNMTEGELAGGHRQINRTRRNEAAARIHGFPGGREIPPSHEDASRADRAIVRQVTGVVLNSPKQPQPMSGRTLRSSISAAVATRNSRPVASRMRMAGELAPEDGRSR